MKNRAHSYRRGFTLLEVLIAVVIFAIVLGAINSVFYAALRLRNRAAEAFDRSAPIEQALNIIRRDLANIVPPSTNQLFGQLQTIASTNTMPGSSSPTFYSATGLIDQTSPFAEVQKVSYKLAPSTNHVEGQDLIRLVGRNLLASTDEFPSEQWLMSGVQSLAFLYNDGTSWRDTWDSTTEPTILPRAIKLQLQLAQIDRTGPVLPMVELVVPLLAQPDTNATTQASTQ